MTQQFTWIPIYEELSRELLKWEDRQNELVAMLEAIRDTGLTVSPLKDRGVGDETFLLKEIDPFTFMGVFNRGIHDQQRLGILAELKRRLGLKNPLPEDFDGIPLLNNMKSWLFGYEFERRPDDVSRLWAVFKAAQAPNPLDSSEFAATFDRALEVRNANVNLTMGLFWIRPKLFIALDKNMRECLKVSLPSQGLSAAFYVKTVKQAYGKGLQIPELSYQAWKEARKPKTTAAPTELLPENNVWLVGAHWSDSEPADQTQRFLEAGVWENGYEDRYLDQVRAMRVGDRIAIKAAATQRHGLPFKSGGRTVSRMTIKAVGTIVANRLDGRTVEVEWEPGFKERDWYFYTSRQTIWRLRRDNELAKKLTAYIFDGVEQDYDWFCERWWGKDGAAHELPPEVKELGLHRPYGVADLLAEGVFLDEADVERALERLRAKKNLILQGPPGVGKTFVARKLAYALMEECDDACIEMVQFHQSYSYEDFVRGYRPTGEQGGSFGLQDGVFFEFCDRARRDGDRPFVFVIDEINRGNLSQIFGELLMLIEADKRDAKFGVPLVYRRENEPRFHVPTNVHLIGLMNVADRSLAMVDYALRRRFAFFALEPRFDSPQFREWLSLRNMHKDLIGLIVDRMTELNRSIAADVLLGPHYQVGHSYFCPRGEDFTGLDRAWYESVVRTEIAPLLEEYWFDDRKRAFERQAALLAP